MNAYRTQRTWVVPLLAAINLLMLNFTNSLTQRNPMELAYFLQTFGFRPEFLWQTVRTLDFGGFIAVGFTAVMYQFTHVSMEHFTSNIIMLFVFGMRVERYYGWWRCGLFYLVGGLAAAFGCWALTGDGYTPLVGASGAVYAITGAYLAHVIHVRGTSRWDLVVGIIVGLLGLFSFGMEWAALAGFVKEPQGMVGVAHGAHVAGFVFGYLVMLASAIRQKRRNRTRITAPAN